MGKLELLKPKNHISPVHCLSSAYKVLHLKKNNLFLAPFNGTVPNNILTALCKAFVRGATSEDHSTYITQYTTIKVVRTVKIKTLVVSAF